MGSSIVRAALALSLSVAPAEPVPSPPPTSSQPDRPATPLPPPEAIQGVSVKPPAATWIALGVSAGLFATGLGFTLTANSIERQAGNVNANGVDTGLTRAKAVQGLNDVRVGNTLLVGAGIALVVAVTFAVLHARGTAEPVVAPAADHPLALQWTLP